MLNLRDFFDWMQDVAILVVAALVAVVVLNLMRH